MFSFIQPSLRALASLSLPTFGGAESELCQAPLMPHQLELLTRQGCTRNFNIHPFKGSTK